MQSVQQLLYSTCCTSDHIMMCNPYDTVTRRCTDIYPFRCRLNCLHIGSRVFIPVSPSLSQITAKVVDSFCEILGRARPALPRFSQKLSMRFRIHSCMACITLLIINAGSRPSVLSIYSMNPVNMLARSPNSAELCALP